jgi:UDP-N-acetylglucosamine diphosphorylase/glucosamine-1-phosphate N-acetyltransferase
MEGALIRGPFALCESGGVKMGAKIYTGTTIGPHSKVGGEVSNSVIFGYSNKGHDGFLGNSVLGEWCNLGADTNNSNLKNNYEEVKLWNYETGGFERTGLQFCGLFMGDHSKCGINTMFNTGTVVGVSANIFGAGFPRNFVPSFAWGGAQGFETYQTKKAFQTAEKVMERRHITLEEADKNILLHIFEEETNYRNWEKS